jgi:hypothetical protein
MSTHVNNIKKKDAICPLFVVIVVLKVATFCSKDKRFNRFRGIPQTKYACFLHQPID